MAFDNYLQERIELILNEKGIPFVAKKMMGGLCFMVDDKMCVGIIKNDLMARVGGDTYEELMRVKGARPMDFTKRPMQGYLFISPEGIDFDRDLEFWIEKALAFNPMAKSSKKR